MIESDSVLNGHTMGALVQGVFYFASSRGSLRANDTLPEIGKSSSPLCGSDEGATQGAGKRRGIRKN